MLVLMGSLGLALSVTLLAGAPVIVRVVLGPGYEPSMMVAQILAPWIFIDAITNVWGIQTMLPFGYDWAFFIILVLAGLLNITLAIPLAPVFKEVGMAIAVLLSCIFVTIAQPFFLYIKVGITPWLGLGTER